MPALPRAGAKPLKAYAWAALALAAFAGAWLILPFMHFGGSDSTRIEELGQDEQSLRSLNAEPSPSSLSTFSSAELGSPGARSGPAGAQSAREVPISASGQAAGGPIVLADKAKPKAASKNAATAARGASDAQASARPGFSRAGPPASTRGPSASGAFVNAQADSSPTPGSRAGAPGGVNPDTSAPYSGQGMTALRQAARLSSGALSSKDEQASDEGKKAFDAAFLRARALTGGPSGCADVAGDVPLNLKDNDPRIRAANFTPPAIGAAGEIKDKNQQYMQQQLIMMLVAVALGGILGPVFSAAGQALARSMGFNAPTQDSMHHVSRGPLTTP